MDIKVPDLELDSRRGLAYYNHRLALRLHRPTLAYLYAEARDYHSKQVDLVAAMRDASSEKWTTIGDLNIGPTLQLVEAMERNDYARDAYAGTIAVVLTNLIKTFRRDFEIDDVEWGNLPKLRCGYSMPRVLSACANNFRHHDDWARVHIPDPRQLRDIEIIAALLDSPLPSPDGAGHQFTNNVSWAVLDALGEGTYDRLEGLVKGVSDEVVVRCRVPESPWTQVAHSW